MVTKLLFYHFLLDLGILFITVLSVELYFLEISPVLHQTLWPFKCMMLRTLNLNFLDWAREIPGGGALPYKPIRDVPFFRVSFFSINSWTGNENWSEIPKQVMIICSRTIVYCFQEQKTFVFPIVFEIFCNLIIPKQGIEMQFFS